MGLGAGLDLSIIEGVISDMDGVLWHGGRALRGMIDFFAFLRDRGLPLVLTTNNSSRTRHEYGPSALLGHRYTVGMSARS